VNELYDELFFQKVTDSESFGPLTTPDVYKIIQYCYGLAPDLWLPCNVTFHRKFRLEFRRRRWISPTAHGGLPAGALFGAGGDKACGNLQTSISGRMFDTIENYDAHRTRPRLQFEPQLFADRLT
jgi:hypothetical protein